MFVLSCHVCWLWKHPSSHMCVKSKDLLALQSEHRVCMCIRRNFICLCCFPPSVSAHSWSGVMQLRLSLCLNKCSSQIFNMHTDSLGSFIRLLAAHYLKPLIFMWPRYLKDKMRQSVNRLQQFSAETYLCQRELTAVFLLKNLIRRQNHVV